MESEQASKVDKKWRRRTALALALILLLTMGPFSYSRGVLQTEFEVLDKYFAARVDLVPIVDEVLGENRTLKAAAGELLRSIEFRDKTIANQRETISTKDETIGILSEKIGDLENRPPEVVEVEVPVEVPGPERIVEIEVPGPERVVEVIVTCPGDPRCPAPPPPPVDECEKKPWRSKCRDGGDNDDRKKPEPEPDPDPPCPKPKPKPKPKCGKKHKEWRYKK